MKKYLIIQQKMVGDVLMSSLLCEHIKTNIPNAEVHFVINEHTKAVVEGNPFIDELILFKPQHRTNKIAFIRLLFKLRSTKFNSVIDVYGKLESKLMTLFARAEQKISYRKSLSWPFYNKTIKLNHNPQTNLGLVIENRLSLLAPILPELKEPKRLPKIYLSATEKSVAKAYLTDRDIDFEHPILMVGIMGSSLNKTYPLPYLAKLLDAVVAKEKVTFLLNFLPGQQKEAVQLIQHCKPDSRKMIRSDIEMPSLRSFLTILNQCDGYLGNEGGAGNMARALDLPNFSIFSPWISKKGWFTDFENPLNHAVHLIDYDNTIEKLTKKEKRKNISVLYQSFKPEIFEQELLTFLEREVF